MIIDLLASFMGVIIVNASEKATNLNLVSKVATITSLFQARFAEAMPDLSPWLSDPATRGIVDPHSIDFGFHFPCCEREHSDYTLLMQVRLRPDQNQIVRIEVSSHSFYGCLWEFSTTADWRFWGGSRITPQYQLRIESLCHDILKIFSSMECSSRQIDM
ncbi:MAG: hypothetical protein KIH63_005375 [Candidatus Saccharibacteria bacterium]|nr:hypothetical protein [Candidatus Saccharibacteria bacterium]